MRKLVLLTQLLVVSAAFADAGSQRSVPDTLGAFVGEWEMELFADEETFGDRGGPGTGTMSCAWGPMQAWVDCELNSHYDGIGSYALKIVLYSPGSGGDYGAFVTNSFGGGRLYTGEWESGDRLVYRDAWVDPRRKWEHQRTTYTFADSGELSYTIEVSSDGVDYLPHSSGIYRRK